MQAGPLATPRASFTATLLSSGKVLAAGGANDGSNYMTGVELYDPDLDAWTMGPPMAVRRVGQTATLLPSGVVLVVGGFGITAALASVELYDPAGNSWSMAAPMHTVRMNHTATLLPSGHVLVVGGNTSSNTVITSTEDYDPANGSWTEVGALSTPRASHTATLLPSGNVLVCGGFGHGNAIASAELYDPATSSWRTAAPLPLSRDFHTATLLPSGQVLVAGGANGNGGELPDVLLYSPTSDTWTTTGALHTPRHGHTASLLPDGRVLIAGGVVGSIITSSNPRNVELYDPLLGQWLPAGELNTARDSHQATLLANGTLLISGGGSAVSRALSSAEQYQPGSVTTITGITPSVSIVGQVYQVSFNVSATSAVPVGSVVVADDRGASCAPVALDAAGNGGCTLASGNAGTRTISASFTPAVSGFPGSSASAAHEVQAGQTSLDVALNPEPATTVDEVIARIALTVAAPGAGVPSGVVVVSQPDSGASCSITLPDTQCTLPPSMAGTHAIEATYLGDTDFVPSSWNGEHITYDRHTDITITSIAPEPSVVGASVLIAYSVVAAEGSTSGSVTVHATTGESCAAAAADGACSMVFQVDGRRLLVADYSGDALHDAAQSSQSAHDVVDASTMIAITSHTPEPSLPFQAIEVGVQLTVASPGSGTPTGPILVSDGVDGCVIQQGSAVCALTLAARGPHTLTASYSGDGNYAASSAQVVHHVNREPVAGTASYSIDEDGILNANAAQGVLSLASDADGDHLSVVSAGASSAAGIGGTVELRADGSFTYTPPADANGMATFDYTISDGLEETVASASITVEAVNDPPSFALADIAAWPAGASGAKTQTGFASVQNFGPGDEIDQHVQRWIVRPLSDPVGVVSNLALAIDGTLSYTLSGRAGRATFGVSLQDDGGSAHGGIDTSVERIFAIEVAAGLDLSIGIDDGTAFAQGGLPINYTISVHNAGPNDAIQARVRDLLPFNLVDAVWTCVADPGAACAVSGGGDIDDTIDLPSGTTLRYELSATVVADPEMPLENTASVTPPAGIPDSSSGNDTATDTDIVGLFADGFDAALPAATLQRADASNTVATRSIELAAVPAGSTPGIGGGVAITVCRVGDDLLLVQRRNTSDDVAQVRLALRGDDRGFVFSPWTAAIGALSFEWTDAAQAGGIQAARLRHDGATLLEVALPHGGAKRDRANGSSSAGAAFWPARAAMIAQCASHPH